MEYLQTALFQEVALLDVINLEYSHRCRADPVEAALYNLEAKREGIERFRAVATVDLTFDLDESTDQQEKNFLCTFQGKMWPR